MNRISLDYSVFPAPSSQPSALNRLIASIDLGTNTLRLLVAAIRHRSLEPIEMLLHMPRIGERISATGFIDDAAFERTLPCLRQFGRVLRAYRVDTVYPFATASLRYAKNRDGVATRIERETGLRFEIISGEEEGHYSFLGATAQLPGSFSDQPVLVVDIGGGSTEFTVGYPGQTPIASKSLRLGSCLLCEKFNLFSFPAAADIRAAHDYIIAQLDSLRLPKFSRIIGVAGTITTLKSLDLKLELYRKIAVQNTRLDRKTVAALCRKLVSLSPARRLKLKGMPAGREDVIFGGCLITRTILDYFRHDVLIVSDEDIMYGILLHRLAWRPALPGSVVSE